MPNKKKQKDNIRMVLPKGRMGLPILGETMTLFRDPYAYGSQRFTRYGEVSRARLMFCPAVMLLSAPGQQWALQTAQADLSTAGGYALIRDLFGESVLLTDGDVHKQLQKWLLPMFAAKRVESYFATINQVIDYRLAQWTEGTPITLLREFDAITFTLGCALLLGMAPDDARIPLWNRQWKRFAAGEAAIFRLRQNPCGKYGRAYAARLWMTTHLQPILASQKRQADPNIIKLLAEQGMPDEAIITQIIFLIDASFDTSANTATWVCAELLQHPAILSRVSAAINDSARDALTPQDAQRTPLMDAVINETLRLHPQVFMFARRALCDLTYTAEDGTCYTIPRGTLIHLNPTFVHRRADYWEAPDTFDPDRFLLRHEDRAHPGAFIGFGAGVHGCMGEPIARLEITLLLRSVFRRFVLTLEPEQDLRTRYRVLPQPASGVRVTVTRKEAR
jgi:retinoid hydroxylase